MLAQQRHLLDVLFQVLVGEGEFADSLEDDFGVRKDSEDALFTLFFLLATWPGTRLTNVNMLRLAVAVLENCVIRVRTTTEIGNGEAAGRLFKSLSALAGSEDAASTVIWYAFLGFTEDEARISRLMDDEELSMDRLSAFLKRAGLDMRVAQFYLEAESNGSPVRRRLFKELVERAGIDHNSYKGDD